MDCLKFDKYQLNKEYKMANTIETDILPYITSALMETEYKMGFDID